MLRKSRTILSLLIFFFLLFGCELPSQDFVISSPDNTQNLYIYERVEYSNGSYKPYTYITENKRKILNDDFLKIEYQGDDCLFYVKWEELISIAYDCRNVQNHLKESSSINFINNLDVVDSDTLNLYRGYYPENYWKE